MNRVIKFLMISDMLVLTSFGLIAPILAIFFKENLVGGSIFAVGIAETIFLFVKGIVQLPFSRYIDSHGYSTRVRWLITGTLIVSLIPFIYILSKSIYWIFVAQGIYGLGSGLAFPAWLGLWSTHLDRKKESFEWSLYSTVTGMGTALTAAVGAALAEFVGFNFTFIIVGCVSFIGVLILLQLDQRPNKLKIFFGKDYHRNIRLKERRA